MSHVDNIVLVKALTHSTETKRFKKFEKLLGYAAQEKLRLSLACVVIKSEKVHITIKREHMTAYYEKNCHLLFDVKKNDRTFESKIAASLQLASSMHFQSRYVTPGFKPFFYYHGGLYDVLGVSFIKIKVVLKSLPLRLDTTYVEHLHANSSCLEIRIAFQLVVPSMRTS